MNYSSKVLFRKSFERSSRSSRYAKKKAIAKLLDEFAENKLKVTNLSIKRVYLENNVCETVQKLESANIIINEVDEKCSSWHALKAKDEIGLSDHHYDSFRKNCFLNSELPSLKSIKDNRSILNKVFELNKSCKGVSNQVLQKLKLTLTPIIQMLNLRPKELIRIRIVGDVTQVSATKKLLSLTFSCLNDVKNCIEPQENFTIGMWAIDEDNYLSLKDCLQSVFQELENVREIVLENVIYQIKVFIGGDLKFLLNIYGLGAANSEFCCLWCKSSKKDFKKIDLNCSTTDTNKNARSIIVAFSNYGVDNPDGYRREPLTRIPFSDAVVDLLHMWLRITDKLITLLYSEICEQDIFKIIKDDMVKKNDEQEDADEDQGHFKNKPRLEKLCSILEFECKISRPYYVSNNKNGNVSLRSLNNDEKVKMFDGLCNKLFSLEKTFKSELAIANIHSIQKLWSELMLVFSLIKNSSYDVSSHSELVKNVKTKCSDWLKLFVEIYPNEQITPYIHVFSAHLYEMIQVHGNINLFSMQGLEKLNDSSTISFYSSTNKHEDFITQLMNKRNRLEIMQAWNEMDFFSSDIFLNAQITNGNNECGKEEDEEED